MTAVRTRMPHCLQRCTVGLLVVALSCLLMQCSQEYVDPTVLHFAVYSDAQLSYVKATLLDEEQPTIITHDFTVVPESRADTTFLFELLVQRTATSENRDYAVVRLDGYLTTEAGPTLVLRRTVRAPFVDQTTRLARVWLARSCVAQADRPAVCPTEGFSCDYASESCKSHKEPLATEPYATTTDVRARWTPGGYRACGVVGDDHCPAGCTLGEDPDCGQCHGLDFLFDEDNCGGCGIVCSREHANPSCQGGRCLKMCAANYDDCDQNLTSNGCETDLRSNPDHCGSCLGSGSSCHYRLCEAGQCLGTQAPIANAAGMRSMPKGQVFLKYADTPTERSIIALGVHVKDAAQSTATLFLAEDMQGIPGRVLIYKEVSLVESTTDDVGNTFGSEVRLDPPFTLPWGLYWIGLVFAQDTTVKVMATPPQARRMFSKQPIETFDPEHLPELEAIVAGATPLFEPLVYTVYTHPSSR